MRIWFLLLIVQATAVGQTQPPHVDFQAMFEPSVVRALLQSSDSKEQAWGAWLAGAGQMWEAIPLLQQMVTKRLTGTDWSADGLPLDAALDALIQLEAKVPPALISSIYKKRAAQALVLLSKLDHDGDALLLDLAAREHGVNWFAAANLLLEHRTPGTAFLLLRNLEIAASINISDAGIGMEFGGGEGRVSDGMTRNTPGYPPLAYYYLSDAAWTGSIVLAQGPRTIYYRRNLSSPGRDAGAPIHETDGPNSNDRLEYVATLSGIRDEMPLKAEESRSIAWSGEDSLKSEIKDFRRDILQRYEILVDLLAHAHLLTAKERSALPKPTIKLQVHDLRSKKKP